MRWSFRTYRAVERGSQLCAMPLSLQVLPFKIRTCLFIIAYTAQSARPMWGTEMMYPQQESAIEARSTKHGSARRGVHEASEVRACQGVKREVNSPTDRRRLLTVDDHEVVHEGLAATLSQDPRFDLVGAASTGNEALQLAERLQPDVAIVDMRLPDVAGDQLCRQLGTVAPAVVTIVLSAYLTEENVRKALQAGASAYVTKAAGLPELRKVLDDICVQQGSPTTGPSVSQIVKRLEHLVEARSDSSALTPQQVRVLELAAEGLTYGEIAERLIISTSTVRFHIQNLKVKFETSSKTEVIVRAIRTGIISAPEDEAVRNDTSASH